MSSGYVDDLIARTNRSHGRWLGADNAIAHHQRLITEAESGQLYIDAPDMLVDGVELKVARSLRTIKTMLGCDDDDSPHCGQDEPDITALVWTWTGPHGAIEIWVVDDPWAIEESYLPRHTDDDGSVWGGYASYPEGFYVSVRRLWNTPLRRYELTRERDAASGAWKPYHGWEPGPPYADGGGISTHETTAYARDGEAALAGIAANEYRRCLAHALAARPATIAQHGVDILIWVLRAGLAAALAPAGPV